MLILCQLLSWLWIFVSYNHVGNYLRSISWNYFDLFQTAVVRQI